MSGTVQPFGTATMGPAITTGAARVQLSNVGCRRLLIRAAKTNTATVFVGDVTVTSVGAGNVLCDLQSGETISLDTSNPSQFYVVSAAAQVVYATPFK